MTLQEFINAYNGTSVGSGQCVALVKQYQVDVLGTGAPSLGDARQYWENYENQPFLIATYEKIPLSAGGAVGDVVVWNGNVGHGAGHIAIVIGNITGNGFTSFDQNWNTPYYCNIENHSYNNVYGFLRPRGGTPPIPPEPVEPSPVGDIVERTGINGKYYGTNAPYTNDITNESQKETNVKYIWEFLKNVGWTLESASVFIGASDLISTLNAGRRPTTSRESPVGLLGWRYWEVEDYVIHGTEWVYSGDPTDIDNSLGRINWYREYNLAWNNVGMNLRQFSESTNSVSNLVQAWINNYAYNTLDYNRLYQVAKKWYDFLKYGKNKNYWKYLYSRKYKIDNRKKY